MLIETQIEFLDGQRSGLFSNEPFEKRPVTTIEDFVLHSDAHFESHLPGNGLYTLNSVNFVESTLLSQYSESVQCNKLTNSYCSATNYLLTLTELTYMCDVTDSSI